MSWSISPDLRKVVLVGLMGSGKTTAGALLARRLGWPFHDSDSEILERTGRTVRALRDELGVDGMHALEAEHLLDTLGAPARCVVAAAASTVEVDACRLALTSPGVAVVWLKGSPSVLAHRFEAEAHRPAYGDDPAVFLATQAARRDPLFRALSPKLVIDVDTAEQAVTVERIFTTLTRSGPTPAP